MKNINNNSFLNLIKSKGLILISSSFLLSSCTVYTGGYSETDGVYYDPNKDSLPAGTYSGNYGNQVDDYYNYQDTSSIYDNNQKNLEDQQNRYTQTLTNDSDWGSYTGTETNYSSFNNWGWGSYGWGSPFYGSYGWNSPFNSWGWGLGFGWGWGNSFYSPWGWGGFYDPFYSGFYGGYGWGGYYGGYYPYGGYGWGNYYRPSYNRSGINGRFEPQNNSYRSTNNFRGINSTPGFRDIPRTAANSNSNYRNYQNNNGVRNFPNNGTRNFPNNNVRNYQNNGGYRNTPQSFPNNSGVRTNQNGGFRNDGFNSAPMRSGNSGGFNSDGGFRSGGGSTGGGGGFRSGGGRR